MREITLSFLTFALIQPFLSMAQPVSDDHMRIYVGTYTRGESRGIYLLDFNLASGELRPQSLAANTVNPSFLAVHPSGKFLYAVNEVSDLNGEDTGGISAFRIDSVSGELSLLNQQPSGGTGPCYVTVDQGGKNVLVANYGGGSVASFPVREDGSLGAARSFDQHVGSSVNPERQEGPHAHSIVLDPANRFALSADLGMDSVLVYAFDAEAGTLSMDDSASAAVEAGSGPRHLVFRPDGRFVYLVNEMALTVTAFMYDPDSGTLTEVQTISTLPGDARTWYSGADIHVHPSGKFLFASNRGHDSIAVFGIDRESGKLGPVEYQSTQGKTPRNFAIDPTGQYLLAANQGSDTIVVFRIDQETGALSPTGKSASVPVPVCLAFGR